MKVKDLIERLKQFDPEYEVVTGPDCEEAYASFDITPGWHDGGTPGAFLDRDSHEDYKDDEEYDPEDDEYVENAVFLGFP